MHLNDIRDEVHQTAIEHGWWEDTPDRPLRTFGDCIALIHSEVSEALEEFRDGHAPNEVYFKHSTDCPAQYAVGKCDFCNAKPEGVPVELADIIIRIADLAGRHNINLDLAVVVKMGFNKTRPKYHGSKAI